MGYQVSTEKCIWVDPESKDGKFQSLFGATVLQVQALWERHPLVSLWIMEANHTKSYSFLKLFPFVVVSNFEATQLQ